MDSWFCLKFKSEFSLLQNYIVLCYKNLKRSTLTDGFGNNMQNFSVCIVNILPLTENKTIFYFIFLQILLNILDFWHIYKRLLFESNHVLIEYSILTDNISNKMVVQTNSFGAEKERKKNHSTEKQNIIFGTQDYCLIERNNFGAKKNPFNFKCEFLYIKSTTQQTNIVKVK